MGKKKTTKKRVGRVLLWVMIVTIVLSVSGFVGWMIAVQKYDRDHPKAVPLPGEALLEKKLDKSVRLIATGDMLAHDSVNSNAKTATDYDYTKFFARVKTFTSSGDIRFCNQEGLSAGEEFGITGYPSFNAPKSFSRDLQKIGCNTINLANNHMADKGQAAIDATVSNWEALKPLAISGANRTVAERDTIKYIELKGIKVAFVTFNEVNNNLTAAEYSVTLLKEPVVTQLMTEARKNADFVMVSAHWGNYEDSTEVGPLEVQWTKRLAELGADVVIGTGPHVLQRAEWQDGLDGRKVLVWYSLGNFLSAQLELKQRISGIASMKLEKTGDSKIPVKITKVGFLPTYMHYDWPAADRVAEKLETRTNLMLYPLSDAGDPLSRSGFGTNVVEQQKAVRQTLGSDITILTPETAKSF